MSNSFFLLHPRGAFLAEVPARRGFVRSDQQRKRTGASLGKFSRKNSQRDQKKVNSPDPAASGEASLGKRAGRDRGRPPEDGDSLNLHGTGRFKGQPGTRAHRRTHSRTSRFPCRTYRQPSPKSAQGRARYPSRTGTPQQQSFGGRRRPAAILLSRAGKHRPAIEDRLPPPYGSAHPPL